MTNQIDLIKDQTVVLAKYCTASMHGVLSKARPDELKDSMLMYSVKKGLNQLSQQLLSSEHSDADLDHNSAHKEHVLEFVGFMMITFILLLYLTIGSYMEIKMFRWGHETGIIILLGMLLSVIIASVENEQIAFLRWNNTLFFDLLLPLIIFTTGYNIRRKQFFGNIVNISKFGLLGTFLTFIFLSLMTYALFEIFDMQKYNPITGKTSSWKLDIYSVCYMCSILTGSDIIAFVTLVKFEEYPNLFSIVLGEGLYNDVVVIILYESMKEIAQSDEEGKGLHPVYTPLKAVGDFFKISIGSIMIGAVAGLFATIMTKKLRFISHSAVFETTLLIAWAMFAYLLSELLSLSAICSLLICSLFYSHYTWYNLSPQGQHVTSVTFQSLGYMAEALVFAYIGLTSCYYFLNFDFSWQFIIAQFFFVLIARTLGIFISYYAFECCQGSPSNRLSNKEIMFAVYAAYIRGAIAFGLSTNLAGGNFGDHEGGQDQAETEVVQSTILALVIITTILFGGFTPMVKSCLMGKQTTVEERAHQDSMKRISTMQQSEVGKQLLNQAESRPDQYGKSEIVGGKGNMIFNPNSKSNAANQAAQQKNPLYLSGLGVDVKKEQARDTQLTNTSNLMAQYMMTGEHQESVLKQKMFEKIERMSMAFGPGDRISSKKDQQKEEPDIRKSIQEKAEGSEDSPKPQPSDHTAYHNLMHPNLQKDEEKEAEKEQQKGFGAWLSRIDNTVIRPRLIYKYERQKKRIQFEFADVLKEYQMIEKELNENSDEDENLLGLPQEYRDLSSKLERDDSIITSQGLLSQYIRTKMARQAVGDYYRSAQSNQDGLSKRYSTQNVMPRISEQSGKSGKFGKSISSGSQGSAAGAKLIGNNQKNYGDSNASDFQAIIEEPVDESAQRQDENTNEHAENEDGLSQSINEDDNKM